MSRLGHTHLFRTQVDSKPAKHAGFFVSKSAGNAEN